MFDGLFDIWNKLECVCLVVWNVEVLALPLDKLCCGLSFRNLFWTTHAWAYIFLHMLGHISSYGLFNVEPMALSLDAQLVPVMSAQCGKSVTVHVVL